MKHQMILNLLVFRSSIKIPAESPRKPARNPSNVYIKRKILNAKLREKSGIAKDEIPVMATIIIKIGLTKFALTADSPKNKGSNNSYCWTNWSGDS